MALQVRSASGAPLQPSGANEVNTSDLPEIELQYDPTSNDGGANKSNIDTFMEFLSKQEVDRDPSDPFIHERIADSKDSLPQSVRDFEPDGLWNSLTNADDAGNHKWNQRLPDGYHLTVDEGQEGVFVHKDFYDPTESLDQTLKHWMFEVRPNHESTFVDKFPDWQQ